jgi:putative glycerol-1-phosphate prenyltransferase
LIQTAELARKAELSKADMIFIGGSLVSDNLSDSVEIIKKNCKLPVLLFPGSVFQITNKADGILFLSLISGRNPDYLIGNHVIAAPYLKRSSLEIIPVAYILINGSGMTSVEYMSNTKPIPPDKVDIIVATALAGEMTGQKAIYLEAGSGAEDHVPINVIRKVRENIEVPLIVGGGIRTVENAQAVYNAGADIIVVGNALETDPDLMRSFAELTRS